MRNQTKDPNIIILIDNVRTHPVLYDYRLPGNHNDELKDKIWTEIAGNCSMATSSEAKTTWKRLHTSFTDFYRNELIRLVRANYNEDVIAALPEETQSSEEKLFGKRPWCYYSDMRFIAPFRIKGIDPVLDRLIELAKPVVMGLEDVGQKTKRHSVEWIEAPSINSLNETTSNNLSLDINNSATKQEVLVGMDVPAIETQDLTIEETCLRSFFDSLYRSTNTLPKSLQRKVKRQMLEILNNAEAEAEEMKSKI